MSPTYTILIPHNNGEGLDATIQSVLSQTFTDWQLLISVTALISAPSDSRITLIVQEPCTKSSSLNDLMTYARADWICTLECGDTWKPTKLERQHAARLGPGAEAGVIGENRDSISGYIPHQIMLHTNPFVQSSCMMKAIYAYWCPEVTENEHYDLWLKLDASQIKMYITGDNLVEYHSRPINLQHINQLLDFHRPYILAKNKKKISRDTFYETRLPRCIPPNYTVLVDIHDFPGPGPFIYIQLEPEIIVQQEDFLIKNWHKYDRIYTFNERVFKSCPNAIKYVYGTKWLHRWEYEAMVPSKKEFAISCICGTKYAPGAKGHFLRMVLYKNQKAFNRVPMTLFRSYQKPELLDFGNNPFLGERKTQLFEKFQFSIIIENSKQTNYFTEKIMDCLLAKTIPIYYGCPNIGDFFDTRGFIIIESEEIEPTLNELYNKIATLDETYYSRHLEFVERNFKTAHQYMDIYTNIEKAKKKDCIEYY
jgi:glycosyltransferase involved in cell wall biosynthesis